jgi:ribokinase
VKVIVDPAPAANALPAELLAADVICPNETEAARLTGQPVENAEQACRAAEWLRTKGAAIAIVKRGRHGVVVATGGDPCREFASFPVEAVDTTGAGDAFAGALAVALAEKMPLDWAMRFACAAGAVAASREGAQIAMPTREDVGRLFSPR